jgi:hypothetical protein
MSTFILIFFSVVAASGPSPQYLGVYSSEQACQVAAIETGAILGQSKPKFLCVRQ